jgi:hypothetical protein
LAPENDPQWSQTGTGLTTFAVNSGGYGRAAIGDGGNPQVKKQLTKRNESGLSKINSLADSGLITEVQDA